MHKTAPHNKELKISLNVNSALLRNNGNEYVLFTQGPTENQDLAFIFLYSYNH